MRMHAAHTQPMFYRKAELFWKKAAHWSSSPPGSRPEYKRVISCDNRITMTCTWRNMTGGDAILGSRVYFRS